MESKSLLFKDNLEVLTIEELGRTQREDAVGMSARDGLRHIDLINDLAETLDKNNMKFEIEGISVRKGGPKTAPNASLYPYLEEKWGPNAVEAHVVRKLVTRINIDDLSDKMTQASIGIGFNQNGVIVAFGQNVFVCSNMSIWGENVISSYGPSKMTLPEIFARYGDWVSAFEAKRKADLAIINKLMKRAAKPSAIPELIGELQIAAVNQAYLKGDQSPFNINQVTDFTKNYLKKLNHEEVLDIKTMWDLYNIGTRLLRAKEVRDLGPIYHQNQVFGNFIADKVGIAVDAEIIA